MAGLNYNIIGIIGVARSGKDTAAKYISEKYNYYPVDFSNDGLEPLLKERNITPTKDNKSIFAKDLRKKESMDVLAKLLWKNIKQQDNKNIVVSGFRCIEEINYLNSKAKKITFIKLTADEKFLLKYGSKEDALRNKKDLQNFGFEKVLNYPALEIENNGTMEDLFRKIDSAIIQIKD